MRSKDWKPKETAKLLVIGEDPNLQWSDTPAEYPMFANYYFQKVPYDHGERSRYNEAKNLFEMIKTLTDYTYAVDEVFITHLCNESLEHAPKGKRTLIPENLALKGVDHIRWILEQNPEIDLIFACSMQTNYWLQKTGLVPADEAFLKGAEPRRTGIQSYPPFYQPVNGKVFGDICGKFTHLTDRPSVRVLPLLPAKDFPLRERNLEQFGEAYDAIRKSFE
ncbi:MAG: hypothetical protein RR346_10605 [Bacteroidales bacterium]